MHHSSLQQSLLTQTKPNIETCGSSQWCKCSNTTTW